MGNFLNYLEIRTGLIWSLLWVLLILLLGSSKSLEKALMSGLVFMMSWIVVSFVLYLLCIENVVCVR